MEKIKKIVLPVLVMLAFSSCIYYGPGYHPHHWHHHWHHGYGH